MKRHALGGEQTLKQVRQLEIEPEAMRGRNSSTSPEPSRNQTEPSPQTDRACTDHNQFL
jgi:hypothetical protein